MISTELGRSDESMDNFSSRAFAHEYSIADQYPDAHVLEGADIFHRIMAETNTSTSKRSLDRAPVVAIQPSVLQSWTEIPEIFTRTFDKTWEYKPMDRIEERQEWLGVTRDEEGKAIQSIMGSVVGRTGREVVVIYPGNVKENMIQVDTYVRWDPNYPKLNLLEIGELIQGDTGPEVRVSQNMQPLAAKAYEYSGWYHKRSS